MHKLLGPAFLKKMTHIVFPWVFLAISSALVLNYTLLLRSGLEDYQQGVSALILFLHVPASWSALGFYVLVATMAISGLVWKTSLSFFYARAGLYVGCCCALISLLTGAVWGKPTWGTYWVFDARLTSMLLLALMYFGLLSVAREASVDQEKQKGFFILVLIGLINIPVIKFSVEWWTTLHQGASIFRANGPALDPSFLKWLLSSTLLFGFFWGAVLLVRAYVYFEKAKEQKQRFAKERFERFKDMPLPSVSTSSKGTLAEKGI